MASEESKVIKNNVGSEVLAAFNRIPYTLISSEVGGAAHETLDELTKICQYYNVYRKGARFLVEGTNGDYVAANLRYKLAASLINKEARFLFAEPPDITIEAKGDVGKITQEARDALTNINDLVRTVLAKNNFEDILLKGAKDCFIGKRVAALVNFNCEDGITVTFLPSTQFVYETKMGNANVISKFVCFITVNESRSSAEKRIFKKKYTLENGKVYLEEGMYDGAGRKIENEDMLEKHETDMPMIPAVVFINDGLTAEYGGESEVETLKDFESWYSRLANADIDAERKSMNPTKYVVDMDSNSTKNLSSSAGAFWDLSSDQQLDNPNPEVGVLESSMAYSESLKVSLDRLRNAGYEQVDVPNISTENMQGLVTSGKTLKAIYWPLVVRCKEKMKVWGPQLAAMVNIIIVGAMKYPDCTLKYTNENIVPVDYEIKVVQNLPLPEDEAEEKQVDLSEVDSNVMSRKSYMKKWRNLTDAEIDEELKQIAYERQIIEDSSFDVTEGAQPY